MLENSYEVYEKKVTREDNISVSRGPTDSFPSDIVKTYDKHKILLMIEAEETPQTNITGNLKDSAFF